MLPARYLAGRSTQAAANARASDPGAAWRQALASSWRQALARVAPPWVASRVQVLPALAADSGPFGSRRARSGQDFAFGSVPSLHDLPIPASMSTHRQACLPSRTHSVLEKDEATQLRAQHERVATALQHALSLPAPVLASALHPVQLACTCVLVRLSPRPGLSVDAGEGVEDIRVPATQALRDRGTADYDEGAFSDIMKNNTSVRILSWRLVSQHVAGRRHSQ